MSPGGVARGAAPGGGRSSRRRGVALVITMILLAVITTLAIAFLALTYRETGAVDSKARTTDAELGAESALERAKAQIVSEMLLRNLDTNHPDIMGPDLQVSVAWNTNRLAPGGGNLFYDPSPPVFVDTNRGAGLTLEDRFSLDLNRNTNYETTGWAEEIDQTGAPIAGVTNWVVGDPHWIGLLQDPLRPHGPDNRFIARYAYLIQPIGRTLDLNWIHNQTLESLGAGLSMEDGSGFNGFYRNQGIGPWEMNLAAFLTDLNTNSWGNYRFNPMARWDPPWGDGPNAPLQAFAQISAAFNDARELLRYRYLPLPWDPLAVPPVSPWRSNDTLNALLASAGSTINDGVFAYANTFVLPFGAVANDNDDPAMPWPGSDSKRHFFTVHDVFNQKKLPERPGGEFQFRNRLQAASAQPSTYDRYTYYRMLAQLGTDSAPGEKGKLNLNFINIRSWRPGAGPDDELFASDMISWTNLDTKFDVIHQGRRVTAHMGRPGPELFLLSVATNLFRREAELVDLVRLAKPGQPFRIPIFTNGSAYSTNGPLYSGRIHQILKVAANILDAMRPEARLDGTVRGPEYPTVFAPVFERDPANNNIYIVDYVLAPSFSAVTNKLWRDLGSGGASLVGPNDGIYGIPFIIGARKGYPSFNELAVKTDVEAVRRLKLVRATSSSPLVTNQVFTLSIHNHLGFEAWNSYTNYYPRPLQLYFGINSSSLVTNSLSGVVALSNVIAGASTSMVARAWQPVGAAGRTDFVWREVTNQFVLGYTNYGPIDPGGATNRWFLAVTNRALYYLADNDHIVDAVSLAGPTNLFDIAGLLHSPNLDADRQAVQKIWSNGKAGGNEGVFWQMLISTTEGDRYATQEDWRDYTPDAKSRTDEIPNFRGFISSNIVGEAVAPFGVVRRMEQETRFVVNDPMVHYTMEDFTTEEPPRTESVKKWTDFMLGTKNNDYAPWGTTTPLEAAVIDPGVTGSDAWEFPTNRFPSVGWLGRVHRATPWQTIYFKSGAPALGKWALSTGRVYSKANKIVRPGTASLLPTNDWRLVDIFTTEIHPNAARGRLSINQTNAAAWSALLAGVLASAVTNDSGAASPVPVSVEPQAIAPAVARMVEAINAKRGTNQFTRLSDILSVSAFTSEAMTLLGPGWFPGFLPMTPAGTPAQFKLRDSDYERLPEQVLSLLKVGEPRFAVYAWGQSLKPARFGVAKNGRNVELRGPSILTADVAGVGERGTVINYQVTGEMATRAIVNVEFEWDPTIGAPDYRRPRIVVESFNTLPNE